VKIKVYRTIILPVVLYRCETWSLKLREKLRLGRVKTMVLRKILGPKRDELTGECRRFHSEEPDDLYSSPCIMRV
jgi:hypothetical protein